MLQELTAARSISALDGPTQPPTSGPSNLGPAPKSAAAAAAAATAALTVVGSAPAAARARLPGGGSGIDGGGGGGGGTAASGVVFVTGVDIVASRGQRASLER